MIRLDGGDWLDDDERDRVVSLSTQLMVVCGRMLKKFLTWVG